MGFSGRNAKPLGRRPLAMWRPAILDAPCELEQARAMRLIP
ncbi:hypothetical protein L530_0503 [Bordetella bronchiseptica MO211]|nr:hypothetical protein L530_0503 [Bordetella bronchiseptica MO211]